MGWDPNELQGALDTCTNPSGMIEDCAKFTVNYNNYDTCQYNAPSVAATEDCAGPRQGLCGNPSANPAAPLAAAPSAVRQAAAPAPVAAAPPPPPPPAPVAAPAPTRNVRISYETVTEEQFFTTTVWDKRKRTLPTEAAQAAQHRHLYRHRRAAHEHHHQANL
jgi:hypothetical protein